MKRADFKQCVFGKSNLKSDLDRRAFSNTASASRPARLKQRPHHLKRFWQAPTSDLNRFWPISIVFDSFLYVFERFLEKSPKASLNPCLKRLGNGPWLALSRFWLICFIPMKGNQPKPRRWKIGPTGALVWFQSILNLCDRFPCVFDAFWRFRQLFDRFW